MSHIKQKTKSVLAAQQIAGVNQPVFCVRGGIKTAAIQISYVECCLTASVFLDECISLPADTITETGHGFQTGLKGTISIQIGCAAATPSACISVACNVITEAAHGFTTGERGRFTTSNTLPSFCCGVISACTDFFIISLTAGTYNVATTRANSIASTGVCITGAGVGCQTFTPNGAIPTGLSSCADASFIIRTDVDTYQIASSKTNAIAGTNIDITALQSPATTTFTASCGDATSGTIEFHSSVDGELFATATLVTAIVINTCTPTVTVSEFANIGYSEIQVDVDITDGQFTFEIDATGKEG